MSTYADTGFVVSLYKAESTSVQAARVMKRIVGPVLLSPLGELEIHNAFQLAVFRGQIPPEAALLKIELFREDQKAGIFDVRPVPSTDLYGKAIELADRHSARLGTRNLDLMHVAAALLLGAGTFLSFDDRQRHAAKAEGLKLKP